MSPTKAPKVAQGMGTWAVVMCSVCPFLKDVKRKKGRDKRKKGSERQEVSTVYVAFHKETYYLFRVNYWSNRDLRRLYWSNRHLRRLYLFADAVDLSLENPRPVLKSALKCSCP